MTTNPRVTALRAGWASLGARDRRLLALAAAVLALYALYAVAIQPAWRTLRGAPAQLEALETELQAMQRLASEASELRATPPVNTEQATAALKAASERLGDKARLSVQGDRAVLTLTGAGSVQLRSWLAEVRSGARARPVEATLTRSGSGYTGSIVVAIGGAP